MSYAIYHLRVGQDVHEDFRSYHKHKHQVLGDAMTFVIEYFRGLSTEPVTDKAVLEADLHLLNEFVYKQLPDIELKVIEVMDADTCERIDEMIAFQDVAKKYSHDFNFTQNREAELLISRLDFGTRRLLDRRFSKYWLEGDKDELAQQQVEFIWYSNQIRTFNALVQNDIDMVRFEQYMQVVQGIKPDDVVKPEGEIIPGAQYIWWTTQGDCESTMDYHERARFEGKMTFGGPLRDEIYHNLRSRNGRHAKGSVWGLRKQPHLTSDPLHQYIQRYCGGIAITGEDVKTIRHNLGFVTTLDLKLVLNLGI